MSKQKRLKLVSRFCSVTVPFFVFRAFDFCSFSALACALFSRICASFSNVLFAWHGHWRYQA